MVKVHMSQQILDPVRSTDTLLSKFSAVGTHSSVHLALGQVRILLIKSKVMLTQHQPPRPT